MMERLVFLQRKILHLLQSLNTLSLPSSVSLSSFHSFVKESFTFTEKSFFSRKRLCNSKPSHLCLVWQVSKCRTAITLSLHSIFCQSNCITKLLLKIHLFGSFDLLKCVWIDEGEKITKGNFVWFSVRNRKKRSKGRAAYKSLSYRQNLLVVMGQNHGMRRKFFF